MSLHDRIMNIQVSEDCPEDLPARLLFKQGHKEARHVAAEWACEYDSLVEDMADALKKCQSFFETNNNRSELISEVLQRYKALHG